MSKITATTTAASIQSLAATLDLLAMPIPRSISSSRNIEAKEEDRRQAFQADNHARRHVVADGQGLDVEAAGFICRPEINPRSRSTSSSRGCRRFRFFDQQEFAGRDLAVFQRLGKHLGEFAVSLAAPSNHFEQRRVRNAGEIGLLKGDKAAGIGEGMEDAEFVGGGHADGRTETELGVFLLGVELVREGAGIPAELAARPTAPSGLNFRALQRRQHEGHPYCVRPCNQLSKPGPKQILALRHAGWHADQCPSSARNGGGAAQPKIELF